MTGPVVVGIDKQTSAGALELAAAFARSLDTRLVLAHVAAMPVAFPYGNPQLQELLRRKALLDGHRLLRRVASEVEDIDVETRVELGPPVEALRRLAHETEAVLVVLAPRRRGSVARALSRGTTGALAEASPCPVVVMPPLGRAPDGSFASGAPIVVGADGTANSGRATVVADALGERLGLPVVPVGVDVADEAARATLRYRNVHPRPGQALGEITRRLSGAMLVVGTRGGSSLSGSIAQRLIVEAPVPVVVVPERSQGA